ncbi:hypothetical protein DTO271G3_2889 [Paecilomyces variotii]|nr:hypothetical protein DTO271G3_2889 [Paecilomyces variotii]
MKLKSGFRMSPKIGSRPLKKEKDKERDSCEKPSRRRSLTESVQSLVKHAFSRRDDSGSRKSNGHDMGNNGGKRSSSAKTTTSSSSWVKLPPPSDDIISSPSSSSSYYSSASHVNPVQTPVREEQQEKQEIHEEKETSQLSLPETPPFSSSSDPTATSSRLPKIRVKAGQQKEKPSRIPTPTKTSSAALGPSKEAHRQDSGTMNTSASDKVDEGKDHCVGAMVLDMEKQGLIQQPLQRQENLRGGIAGKEIKELTSSPPKNQQAARRTSRLPRSSGHNTPVASPEKRTTNMRMSLPASKSLSTGLSSVQTSRRGSLPHTNLPINSTRKLSTTAVPPSYGNQKEAAGRYVAITSPGRNVTGRIAGQTDRRQSNVRASSIAQRQLLGPLGPPMPRSQTFDSFVQPQKAKQISSGKRITSRVPRLSDVSDRNGHGRPQNGNEHAEIVEILKATRLSKNEIEDEEPKKPRKSDVIEATPRDFEVYEVGSSILEGVKQEIEGEESERMVYEAKEEEWWLGRFMTLSSGFYFTDSFDSPDLLTWINTDTGISRPPECLDEYLGDIRTCRVFILLERMCATKEARESLRHFRNAYISSSGDEWTEWLSDDYRRRWRLDDVAHSKGNIPEGNIPKGNVRRPSSKRI